MIKRMKRFDEKQGHVFIIVSTKDGFFKEIKAGLD